MKWCRRLPSKANAATVTTTAWYVMGDPFGIDDIYIALITPAIVMLIEWLVRGTRQSEGHLVRQ